MTKAVMVWYYLLMMKKLLLFFAILAFSVSCSQIKEDISDLQNRVDSIEKQLLALQKAYDDGKIIKEVTPYEDDERTGWTIKFSDNSTILIYNGEDGEDAPITITSVEESELDGIIKLIMSDGSEYEFNLDVTFPTGVVVLAER